jgi:AcrR family transcriptional regulator
VMSQDDRRLRADAERNRKRLLEAAEEAFREHGLDVGVAEIAQRAGVGRGTLFRNFPTKEDLISAIVVERMHDAVAFGQTLLDDPDPAGALWVLLEHMAGRQQLDRALFEAVADTWLANQGIRCAHAEVMGVLEQLLIRAQEAGAIRPDVGAFDVLMMVKGVCEAASSFAHIDPDIATRQLDLVRAALTARPEGEPLRGRSLRLEDIERAFPAPDSAVPEPDAAPPVADAELQERVGARVSRGPTNLASFPPPVGGKVPWFERIRPQSGRLVTGCWRRRSARRAVAVRSARRASAARRTASAW